VHEAESGGVSRAANGRPSVPGGFEIKEAGTSIFGKALVKAMSTGLAATDMAG
jgi:hypothetical protein